jgi:membrane protein YdbS with pleckstrin-like domain
MDCSSCGADVASESVYCPKCGERLNFEEGAPDKPGPIEKFRESTQRDDDLGSEEHLWHGGYSGKAMIGPWCGAAVSTLLLVVGSVMFAPAAVVLLPLAGLLWVYLLGLLAYRKMAVRYELTTQRFIHKFGILKQVTDRIEVIDIDDVTFEQGIVQRLMGVGTVKLSSSDRTHPELTLKGIDEVERIADQIDDVRRKERRARGLHIEAI